jgi:hypothetical protein
MTERQLIISYGTNIKRLNKHLKMFSKFKLAVEDALDKQRHGHTYSWVKVQNSLEQINDNFDCEAFLNDY